MSIFWWGGVARYGSTTELQILTRGRKILTSPNLDGSITALEAATEAESGLPRGGAEGGAECQGCVSACGAGGGRRAEGSGWQNFLLLGTCVDNSCLGATMSSHQAGWNACNLLSLQSLLF